MELWISTALGVLIAFLLGVPALILETSRRVKNLPLLIDVHVWRGHKLNDGEVFAIGMLLHLVFGGLYGLLYTVFAETAWLGVSGAAFSLTSMLAFAVVFWLLLNVVVFPLAQFGFFGSKEGKTVWYETLISLVLEGAILWVAVQLYQPYFFFVS